MGVADRENVSLWSLPDSNNFEHISYSRTFLLSFEISGYLLDYQLNILGNATLFSSRSDEVLTIYSDAVAQSFSHPEAESIASNVFFDGLRFGV